MPNKIRPFELAIDESELTDLHTRLSLARWPEAQTCGDQWQQGVPLNRAKSLVDYWLNAYDWRECECELNSLGQFKTQIDGLDIHFLHVRSKHKNALPIVLTHGWPGSVLEFRKIIGPLVDPEAHGGSAEDAFHVIAPSLPGYGFSGKPTESGWGVERIAAAWLALIRRLGYARFVAQGGDWGSAITTALACMAPPELAAIHLNMVAVYPQPDDELTETEQTMMADFVDFQTNETGYSLMHITRPQTLGYSLADSPVGQAMWVYEKFQRWSDCDGDPENVFSRDELLDNIMLYWLGNNGASSARLYKESYANSFAPVTIDIPVGCSIFPHEIVRPSKWMAERSYKQLIYWNEPKQGGHFAAYEQPEIFVQELRDCFKLIR